MRKQFRIKKKNDKRKIGLVGNLQCIVPKIFDLNNSRVSLIFIKKQVRYGLGPASNN